MGSNRIIRLLTIGNSFAGNTLTFLQDIAAPVDGVRFEIGRANLGGCSLQKHSNLAEFTEKTRMLLDDGELHARKSKEAIDYTTNFDLNRVGEMTEEVYNKVLAAHGRKKA